MAKSTNANRGGFTTDFILKWSARSALSGKSQFLRVTVRRISQRE